MFPYDSSANISVPFLGLKVPLSFRWASLFVVADGGETVFGWTAFLPAHEHLHILVCERRISNGWGCHSAFPYRTDKNQS
jgi:hypothetical protein